MRFPEPDSPLFSTFGALGPPGWPSRAGRKKKYGFECFSLHGICAVDKYACASLKGHLFLSTWRIFSSEPLAKLKKQIKNCPHIAYKLKMSDMCGLEEKKCVARIIKYESQSNKYTSQVRCPCPKDYSFECGSKYCALDSDVCRTFKAKNITLGKSELKSCQINNIIRNRLYLERINF
jgi:hypothetical protein